MINVLRPLRACDGLSVDSFCARFNSWNFDQNPNVTLGGGVTFNTFFSVPYFGNDISSTTLVDVDWGNGSTTVDAFIIEETAVGSGAWIIRVNTASFGTGVSSPSGGSSHTITLSYMSNSSLVDNIVLKILATNLGSTTPTAAYLWCHPLSGNTFTAPGINNISGSSWEFRGGDSGATVPIGTPPTGVDNRIYSSTIISGNSTGIVYTFDTTSSSMKGIQTNTLTGSFTRATWAFTGINVSTQLKIA